MKWFGMVLIVSVLGGTATPKCAQPMREAPPSLKEAFKGDFLIGAAINPSQFLDRDSRSAALIKAQFNTITAENVLKWQSLHPRPGSYYFNLADRYVEFGEQNHMVIIGHNLIWHAQTPAWVFQDDSGRPVTREVLLERMRDHIHTVVGRYKGRIKGWDVVNEALNSDGSMRQSSWFKIIGEDYIAKAFEFAHEADPDAELYYNDYSLEDAAKRRGAIALIEKLKSQGIPITAIGLQGHSTLKQPTMEEEDDTISDFAKLGVKVMITELDIDVLPGAAKYRGADINSNVALSSELNPYKGGLPQAVQRELAARYAGLFGVFLKHRDVVTRVTFWGVTDAGSWLNNWPVRGRTSYPLLFDREGRPKPAFDAVIQAARKSR